MAVLSLPDFDTLEVECPDLFGISSHLKILSIAYKLSTYPNLQVVKIDDFKIVDSAEQHPIYEIKHLDIDAVFYLIRNKGMKEHLLKGLKSFDFILTSEADEKYNAELIQIITKLKGVSICFALESITETDKLLFEPLL